MKNQSNNEIETVKLVFRENEVLIRANTKTELNIEMEKQISNGYTLNGEIHTGSSLKYPVFCYMTK